jgi:hypothetical protein
MKSFRLLMVGLLCLGVITLTSNYGDNVLKADGVKVVNPTDSPPPPPAPPGACTCTCTRLVIDSASYSQYISNQNPLLGGNNDILTVTISYSMSNDCLVKLVATCRALRYSESTNTTWYDPWTTFASTTGGSYGTVTLNGNAPYGTGQIAWWEVQVYAIRTCDNNIVGASSVETITP